MKKVVSIIGLLLLTATVSAQVDDGWIDQSDFEKFKQQAERVYADFRDSANAQFARALAGKWQPFEVSKPLENPYKPQPKTPPVAPKPERTKQPVPQKLPDATLPPIDSQVPPKPRKMDPPTLPSEVMQASVPFYNAMLKMEVPLASALAQCTLPDLSEESVSQFWKALSRIDMQGSIVELLEQQHRYRLNDWGLYDLTSRLSQSLFPKNENCQVALTVFLLNQMEYDAKMALTGKGLGCLMAISGDVYEVPYVTIENTRYYLFLPHNGQHEFKGGLKTYTATFESANRNVDVKLHEYPLLPEQSADRMYSYTVAGNKVEIIANKSLIEFYGNYPQVEFSVYATAPVGKDFAAAVEKNFRPFVSGKNN